MLKNVERVSILNEGGGPLVSAVSKELSQAHELLENAMRNFNEVDPEFTDVAILEVMAAENRYNALIKQARNIRNLSNKE